MIQDAIDYPRTGDDALTTILIGGVLSLFGFLVIPAILVSGYLVRVLRGSMAGVGDPPVFDDWGDLFIDGLKAFVVGVVYSIVPFLVFTLAVGGVAASAILTGDVSLAAIAGSFLGVLVSGLLGLLAWYVLPAALANFAREDRIGAAFDVGALRLVLLDGDYVVGWLIAFALFLVAGVVVGALNAIPLIGFVAGAFVTFYAAVSAFYVYGRAFDEALGTGPSSDAPSARPAA